MPREILRRESEGSSQAGIPRSGDGGCGMLPVITDRRMPRPKIFSIGRTTLWPVGRRGLPPWTETWFNSPWVEWV